MAKTRMNSGHREILREFAEKKIKENVDRKQEFKLYDKMLAYANKQLRKKYPEEDLVVLRKYQLTSVDNCLTFSFPSRKVDGVYFNAPGKSTVDIPSRRGCGSRESFIANEEFEAAQIEHDKLREENKEKLNAKLRDANSLINFAKYIEDVLEVIKVPKEIEENLLSKSTSLVALSPDVIKRIQADFSS